MTTGPNRNAENVITVYIDPGLEEIVPGFLENRRRDVQTLETALQENNLAQIQIIGHRMKRGRRRIRVRRHQYDGSRLGASGGTEKTGTRSNDIQPNLSTFLLALRWCTGDEY